MLLKLLPLLPVIEESGDPVSLRRGAVLILNPCLGRRR